MISFLALLVGIVLVAVGSAIAGTLPPGAPLLTVIGLLAAIAIDMATGAFLEDDASTTE